MFGMRYIQTCHGCNTVFEFKRAKAAERFCDDHDRHCPCCGGWLSRSPFPRTMLTPPPDLKLYPAYVRTIDMDSADNLLDFYKWPRLSEKKGKDDMKSRSLTVCPKSYL